MSKWSSTSTPMSRDVLLKQTNTTRRISLTVHLNFTPKELTCSCKWQVQQTMKWRHVSPILQASSLSLETSSKLLSFKPKQSCFKKDSWVSTTQLLATAMPLSQSTITTVATLPKDLNTCTELWTSCNPVLVIIILRSPQSTSRWASSTRKLTTWRPLLKHTSSISSRQDSCLAKTIFRQQAATKPSLSATTEAKTSGKLSKAKSKPITSWRSFCPRQTLLWLPLSNNLTSTLSYPFRLKNKNPWLHAPLVRTNKR